MVECRSQLGQQGSDKPPGDEDIEILLANSKHSMPLAISKYLGYPVSVLPPAHPSTIHSALSSPHSIAVSDETLLEWEDISTVEGYQESQTCAPVMSWLPLSTFSHEIPSAQPNSINTSNMISNSDNPESDDAETSAQMYRGCDIILIENHVLGSSPGRRVYAPSPDFGWVDVSK
jgi:hypothetical protein